MIRRRSRAAPGSVVASPVPASMATASAGVDAVRERLVRELPARTALGLAQHPPAVAELLSRWPAGSAQPADTAAALAADLCGAGPLEPLLADDRVTEIMVTGPRRIHVEVDGRVVPCDLAF